jgi:hypothetical protein
MVGGQWVAHPDGIIEYEVNITDHNDPMSPKTLMSPKPERFNCGGCSGPADKTAVRRIGTAERMDREAVCEVNRVDFDLRDYGEQLLTMRKYPKGEVYVLRRTG